MRKSMYLCNKTVACKAFALVAICIFSLQFSSFAQTPGGVSTNLQLWLTAGAGTSTTTNGSAVSTWTDQSTNLFSFTADHTSGTDDPTYVSKGINFNPGVLYGTTAAHSIPMLTGPSLFNSTVFVVGKPGNSAVTANNAVWQASTSDGNTIWTPYLAGNAFSVNDLSSSNGIYSLTNPNDSWNIGEVSFIRNYVRGSSIYYAKQGATLDSLQNVLSSDGTTNTGAFYTLGNNTTIGGPDPFGLINETLIYNTSFLSATDIQKIESYLAFKYGITLDQSTPQNYLASDGTTTFWDGSVGAGNGFNFGVFGIGHDATGSLDQQVAESAGNGLGIADGGFLTLATTNNFVSPNKFTGRASLSDMTFEAIANNNGTAAWTNTGAPSAGFNILQRQWQVQETGTVGNVHLQFDVDNANFDIPALLGGTAYYLVTDPNADGDYSDGDTTALTNTSGSLWSATVDLAGGSLFTIATKVVTSAGPDRGACVNGAAIYLAGSPANTGTWSAQTGNPATVNLAAAATVGTDSVSFTVPGVYYFIFTNGTDTDTMKVTVGTCAAPGGVIGHLALWLKAGSGTGTTTDLSTVSGWSDTTSNALALTSSGNPTYVANSINYNPSVLYASTDYNMLPGNIPISNSSVFVTGIPELASSADGVYNDAWTSADETDFPMIVESGILGYYGIGSQSANTWNYGDPSFGREHIFSSGDVTVSKQGSSITTLPGVSNNISSYYYLGGEPLSGEGFGNIAETLIYDNATMADADIQKIESYMALKYGFTLDNTAGGTAGNYILSDGTPAWDAGNAAYHHDVIGLVRDNASALLQKQSHTKDDSLRIFTATLADINSNNSGTITNDHSSVMIGNDGGRYMGDTLLPKPAGIYSRFARTFKVTNTNFADNFSIEFRWDSVGAFDINDIRLLVSASSDMSAATVYDNSFVTFSLGSIIVSGISNSIIPVNSTMYLTIGSVSALTPLPIGLTNFNANAVNNKTVDLQWQTKSESNNNYFTVQKSADGTTWTDLTQVKGAGTSSIAHSYAAEDNNPFKGVSYYRLKQTDLDGKSTLSPVRTVNIKSGLVNIYPNPAVSTITIEGTEAELNNLRIYNMAGQDVSGLVKLAAEGGSTHVVLNIAQLSRGMYMIKTATTTTKISKQ